MKLTALYEGRDYLVWSADDGLGAILWCWEKDTKKVCVMEKDEWKSKFGRIDKVFFQFTRTKGLVIKVESDDEMVEIYDD